MLCECVCSFLCTYMHTYIWANWLESVKSALQVKPPIAMAALRCLLVCTLCG